MKIFISTLILIFSQLPASKAVVIGKTAPVTKQIAREYVNNKLGYSFIFITNPPSSILNEGNSAVAERLNDSMILLRFRIYIQGWPASPFRFALTDLGQYEERLKFFSFSFNNNILLYQDNELCRQLEYQLDANLNAAPFETVSLAFKLNKKASETSSELKLNITDPLLLKGSVDITIPRKDL